MGAFYERIFFWQILAAMAKKLNLKMAKFGIFFNGSGGTLNLIVHPHDWYPQDHNGEGVAWVPINLGVDIIKK